VLHRAICEIEALNYRQKKNAHPLFCKNHSNCLHLKFLALAVGHGVMHRLGIGYEALKEINPKVIYCAITGYGQTGQISLSPLVLVVMQKNREFLTPLKYPNLPTPFCVGYTTICMMMASSAFLIIPIV